MRVDLFGSLALTGIGHDTPEAVLMGKEWPKKLFSWQKSNFIAD